MIRMLENKDPVTTLVYFLIVFGAIGVFFLFIHMVMGAVIRPNRPDAEKLTIYECGEPTVGSAWVQFDVRYYVVALLFVIFDVEVAFFFPWATVFGKANQLADDGLAAEQRVALSQELLPSGLSMDAKLKSKLMRPGSVPLEPGVAPPAPKDDEQNGKPKRPDKVAAEPEVVPITPEDARGWARVAFFDILIFFGVLMVGFAYVWRRGDIDWVRAYAHHHEPKAEQEKPLEQKVTA